MPVAVCFPATAADINLRYLESLLAYQEMQAAGLVPASSPSSSELAAIIGQVRSAIGARFGLTSSGGFVSWYGCLCANDTSISCTANDVSPTTSGNNNGANQCIQQWDLGFLPAQALAVKLGVPVGPQSGGGSAGAVAALAKMRDAARVVPGQFRTNVNPFESVSPMLWLASDRWNYKTPQGFAIREASQTGDWMIFDPSAGPADGNGNYGTQEENGGALLSTTAFVLEAGNGGPNATSPALDPAQPFTPRSGPYSEMYADWKQFVGALANISAQLQAHDTSHPLLSQYPGFLRRPITNSMIQQLCANPRGSGSLSNKDPWGQAWCDYYKSVSLDLPEDGLVLWSFVRGLLGLYVNAGGQLSLFGQPLPIPGTLDFQVPAGWPQEVAGVNVTGLAVGAQHGVSLSCFVMADVGALSCASSLRK